MPFVQPDFLSLSIETHSNIRFFDVISVQIHGRMSTFLDYQSSIEEMICYRQFHSNEQKRVDLLQLMINNSNVYLQSN